MNFIKPFFTIALLALNFIFVNSLNAQVIRFQDTRCVPRTIQSVHDYLTNYTSYHRNDDNLRMRVPRWAGGHMEMGPRRIINMSTSESWFRSDRQRQENQLSATDAMIWIEMQVTLLRDNTNSSTDDHPSFTPAHAALFPRFFLHCQTRDFNVSDAGNQASFTHGCTLASGEYRESNSEFSSFSVRYPSSANAVGLDAFRSDLRVESFSSERHGSVRMASGSRPCQSGDTVLSYNLNITPNVAHANSLRDAILNHFYASGYLPAFAPRPLVGMVLSPLFDPTNRSNFYEIYYREFYLNWVRPLASPLPSGVQ